MASVAMLIRTSSLLYDDRLRKECLSIESEGHDVQIRVVERENESRTGVTDYGISYHSYHLRLRNILSSGKGLGLKAIEMYLQMIPGLLRDRPEIVWVHNTAFIVLVPLLILLRATGVINQVVWDQHELPPERLLHSSVLRRLYRWVNFACDEIVVANDERKVFLKERDLVPPETHVLSNYPDEIFAGQPEQPLPSDVENWLDGEDYILAQGGANPNRYLGNLVSAFVEGSLPYRLLVVGPYREFIYERLWRRWEDRLKSTVRFTGAVPQMDLTSYIDHADASIIMYSAEKPNKKFCAPNRLYQAISRGCPVIVGSNPPMRKVVENEKCGVVLRSDGRKIEHISEGVRQFYRESKKYNKSTSHVSNKYIWSKQAGIKQILSKL
jgi:glycosyltransferase involved in cell wall biosynthesis